MRLLLIGLFVFVQSAAFAQLLFTEYVEGSGWNKALEISNLGPEPVGLAAMGCQIEMYFNGSEEAGRVFILDAELDSGEAHVFHHRNVDQDYADKFEETLAAAPSTQGGGYTWFNGNDPIVLRCDGEVLDSLGQIGDEDYWGRDSTLRRSDGPAQTDPSEPWVASDYGWEQFSQNTFDGLGAP